MADVLVSDSMLKPNRVDTPSATKINALERDLPLAPTPLDRELHAKAIRVQIRSVQVMDGLQGLWGTNIGSATSVYLITTVVDGAGAEPIAFQGKTYRGINNGAMLPLGPDHERTAVFNVYLREDELPRLLSFSLIVLRSNEDIRELATVFSQIRADERYKSLSNIITTAVSAANLAFGTVWQAAEELVGLVGDYLKAKPDDQLGYYQANYTNAFDNLGVGRHPAEAPTMLVDKIRFAYEINALAD
jgi:hypothetical protein